jgi:hypothetical protein
MWNANRDGGGVAWFVGNDVKYKKGFMKLEQFEDFVFGNKEIKPPFVLHFRIGTLGAKIEEMTHPFLVSKSALNPLEYHGKHGILFHNGHWSKAEDMLLQFCLSNCVKLPMGEISDSRIIAFLSAHIGTGLLKWASGKFVFMKDGKIIRYGKFENHTGILTSNDSWNWKTKWSGVVNNINGEQKTIWYEPEDDERLNGDNTDDDAGCKIPEKELKNTCGGECSDCSEAGTCPFIITKNVTPNNDNRGTLSFG